MLMWVDRIPVFVDSIAVSPETLLIDRELCHGMTDGADATIDENGESQFHNGYKDTKKITIKTKNAGRTPRL
jgi:hypothetical protein